MNITPGMTFATKLPNGEILEVNCVAQSEPDEFGNFDGLDSDGVEVTFNTRMVATREEILIMEARLWLFDCGADPELVGTATDAEIRREVERQCEGGWEAFSDLYT